MAKATLLCLCAGLLGAAAQGPLFVALGDELTPDGFANIRFILHTRSGQSSYLIANASDVLSDPGFDPAKPTALYMHGFNETNETPSTNNVSQAFVQRGSHNIVVVDWGDYVTEFVSAFLRVPAAGVAVGKAINRMVSAGLPVDKLWIIGHSLGGQLAGSLDGTITFKPTRITGLDPAGPFYSTTTLLPQLTADDADVVDVIHTDAGFLGFDHDDGTMNFWPNGGRRYQPGCTFPTVDLESSLVGCSHQRSWWFFSQTVLNDTAFPAVRCGSWHAFNKGLCKPREGNVAYMGFAAPEAKLCGNFYLRTGAQVPFGLGVEGLTPEWV